MDQSKENKEVNIPGRRLTSIADRSTLPRERAMKDGIRALSDVEIMAILLGTGTKGKNVIDLANEILHEASGHLSELMRMSVHQFTKTYAGVGPSKALTLIAALELGRRATHDAAQVEMARKAMTSSQVCYEAMRNKLQNLDHEEFWILLLNNSLKRIAEVRINEGAANFTVVEVKKIIKYMIDYGANHVVLYHNHPSGKLSPSPQDDSLTRKIYEAAKIFDFRVIDHIIISSSGYFSYSDEGRL